MSAEHLRDEHLSDVDLYYMFHTKVMLTPVKKAVNEKNRIINTFFSLSLLSFLFYALIKSLIFRVEYV